VQQRCCIRLFGRFLPKLRPPSRTAFFCIIPGACQLLIAPTFLYPAFVIMPTLECKHGSTPRSHWRIGGACCTAKEPWKGWLVHSGQRPDAASSLRPKIPNSSDCESMVRPTRAGASLAERWGAFRWGDSGTSWQPDIVEATEFGSNPGDLRMFSFVPRKAKAGAALVVALHGCGQTAASYDHGIGWSKLADRLGFALLLRTTSTAASAGSARPTWSGMAANRCRSDR
jgi:hypothetical protein